MEKKSYNVSDIYQGGYSSLNPDYGNFTGYRTNAGSLSITTDPRTANILQEVSAKLSAGLKQIEVAAVSPEIFDSIPKQQLKEVNRISKLTGVDVSVHGPLIEASGIGREGGFSEAARQEAERQLASSVERSHEIAPDGNVPVTFHSSVNVQGPHFNKTKDGEEIEMMPIINQDTGQMNVVKKEVKHYPGMKLEELEKGKEYDVKQQLKIMNNTEWVNSLSQVEFNRENAERIMQDIHPIFVGRYLDFISGKINQTSLTPEESQQIKRIFSAKEYLEQAEMSINSLFTKAYEYGSEEDKKHLKDISENYRKLLKLNENGEVKTIDAYNPLIQSTALFELTRGLENLHPQQFKAADEFAVEKTAKTFGNVAFNSYKKFKDKAPIVSIENPPAGGGLSRGEDLKKVVEKAREQFVTQAKSEGISESEAKKQAEKLIGVTWDVGHINMLRKYGFEEKDIVKETKAIAPFLKHVHLSDNFGFEHTELPMGMGNVPLKEMMEKLGEKGFEARKVIEAAAWWQHFKSSPVQESFEGFGSPIYAMKNSPYWNQSVGLQQGYFSGYGQMLPSINYETFGAGFSQIPQELGGQRPGSQGGRMSGRPLE